MIITTTTTTTTTNVCAKKTIIESMCSLPEIYVGNFPTSFTEEDLLYLFQDFKDITIRSFKKEDHKCFAFLRCQNECQVIDVVTTMHDIDVCKRNLIVRAKDRELQKRIDESLQTNDGPKEQIQSDSRSKAKNNSSNAEKKNSMSTSIDEVVDKFPSAMRFKNPRLQTPSQEKVRSPSTVEPRWKILSQFSAQDSKSRDEVVNNSDKAEIKQNSNNGNNINASILQFLQKKSADNQHQIPCHPKSTQNVSMTSVANSGAVAPENISSRSQELASPQSAPRPQMEQQNFANRGRGRGSNPANGKNVPIDRSNLQSSQNKGTNYQSRGDYSAIAQHFKSTLNVSPSQPNVGHFSNVVPEQDNAFHDQVHANRNSDTKTPMTQQNRGNMRNMPLNNSRSQNGLNNAGYKSNVAQDQSKSTQDNFSVTNLPSTETSFETIPKRLYDADLKSPDSRDIKSYQSDISEINSPNMNTSQNNSFRHQPPLLPPTSQTTPKSLFERGQSLLQKQQLCNQDKKIRRKSNESFQNAENFSRASSSLGSYDGEELNEKLYYLSVANFPFGTSSRDLLYLFEDFEPYNCVMICNIPLWDKRPTEAILGFKSEDQVTDAILNVDNTSYRGRIIIVTDAVDLLTLPSLVKISPKKFKRKQH